MMYHVSYVPLDNYIGIFLQSGTSILIEAVKFVAINNFLADSHHCLSPRVDVEIVLSVSKFSFCELCRKSELWSESLNCTYLVVALSMPKICMYQSTRLSVL
jgi:hypothetical protein